MQKLKTVMTYGQVQFEMEVNKLMNDGYRIVSGNALHVKKHTGDFFWTAILVKEESKTITPQLTLNIDNVRESVDVDYIMSEIGSAIKEMADGKSKTVTA